MAFDLNKALASARLLDSTSWCKDKRKKWQRRRDKHLYRLADALVARSLASTGIDDDLVEYIVENNPY